MCLKSVPGHETWSDNNEEKGSKEEGPPKKGSGGFRGPGSPSKHFPDANFLVIYKPINSSPITNRYLQSFSPPLQI